jgi:hypothetical protein
VNCNISADVFVFNFMVKHFKNTAILDPEGEGTMAL